MASRKPDLGMRVVAAAKQVTPDQASELVAVKLASMHVEQTPILASHYADDVIGPLVRGKLLSWKRAEGWSGKWRMPSLTEFGERVLLHLTELAMIETGRMKAFERECDYAE